jgi:hypothetical protein
MDIVILPGGLQMASSTLSDTSRWSYWNVIYSILLTGTSGHWCWFSVSWFLFMVRASSGVRHCGIPLSLTSFAGRHCLILYGQWTASHICMDTTRITGKHTNIAAGYLRQATGNLSLRIYNNAQTNRERFWNSKPLWLKRNDAYKANGNKCSFICASMTSDISWRHSSFKRPNKFNSLKSEVRVNTI